MPEKQRGVYVVALTEKADTLAATVAEAPISWAAIEQLLMVRPELTLDGQRPTPVQLAKRISAFWLPDETIVYVGLATSLCERVGSFYRTPIGARRPHSGGWFLKTLTNLDQLHVHFATTDFEEAEKEMLRVFVDNVSPETQARLHDPDHPWPFANLELRRGRRKIRKLHGIKGARGDIAS